MRMPSEINPYLKLNKRRRLTQKANMTLINKTEFCYRNYLNSMSKGSNTSNLGTDYGVSNLRIQNNLDFVIKVNVPKGFFCIIQGSLSSVRFDY